MALGQHGPLHLDQLVALGLTPRAVHWRAHAGRLYRIYRAVYALTPRELLPYRGRLMAAALACGPGALISHRSAADLHHLRATLPARIDVTVPGRTTHRLAGIDVHRSVTLTAADVTTVDGIPVTSIARTALDLAGVVSHAQAERALNQAEVMHVLDFLALDDQLERNRTTRAAARLRAAVDVYGRGGAPTESELEAEFLALVRAAGLPEPERQVWLDLPDGEPPFRVDFLWRRQRLVVETDGGRTHLTRRSFEDDRRRDQRLARSGWRAVRLTWRQLARERDRMMQLLIDLVAQA